MENSDNNENWTEIISPRVALFDVRLGEVWDYRDLLWLFVKRDFVAQYKQTILGPIWHIIQPLFTTAIFLLVFRKIANISTDGIDAIPFYMSGITIWNFFSTCLTNTSNTFVLNAGIFGKVYFPRLVLPLSIILSNVVKLGIQFGLLLIIMIWYAFHGKSIHLTTAWLFLPFIFLVTSALGLGLGIIISSFTTKYRDLGVLITFAVQLAMYATPVAYPLSYLDNKSYRSIIVANPMTSLVESFRFVLFGKGTFSVSSIAYSVCFTLVTLFLGIVSFNKVEKTFMDTV